MASLFAEPLRAAFTRQEITFAQVAKVRSPHDRGTKTRSRTFSEAMTVNAARYRTYFEDARKRAEQVSDPVEKQAWLRMAEKWFKLWSLAEQHAPKEA
jgi:hypothetical protein